MNDLKYSKNKNALMLIKSSQSMISLGHKIIYLTSPHLEDYAQIYNNRLVSCGNA